MEWMFIRLKLYQQLFNLIRKISFKCKKNVRSRRSFIVSPSPVTGILVRQRRWTDPRFTKRLTDGCLPSICAIIVSSFDCVVAVPVNHVSAEAAVVDANLKFLPAD